MTSIPKRRQSGTVRAGPQGVRAKTPVATESGLAGLQHHLYAVVTRPSPVHQALRDFCELAVQLTNAVGTAYFRRNSEGKFVIAVQRDVEDLLADKQHRRQLDSWCNEAATSEICQIHPSDTDAAVHVICMPVQRSGGGSGGVCDVLVAYLVLGHSAAEPFVLALQLVASYVSQWYERQTIAALSWEVETVSAVAELVSKMELARDEPTSHYVCVNELQKFLDCQRVALAISQRGSVARLVAVSGMAEFDQQSEMVRALEAALNETLVRCEKTLWPPKSPSDRRATLSHRRLVETVGSEAAISSPLQTSAGDVLGAWVFTGSQQQIDDGRTQCLMNAAAPHVAAALAVVRRAEPTRLKKLGNWVAARRHRSGVKVMLIAAILLIGLLLFPLPYKVRCGASVEPQRRRFAVAPYSGVLQKSLVQTGDVIQAGQVLAVMDGRELRWELAGLAAERNRAAKKRDASMAAHDVAEAQMAELELDRLQYKMDLLQYREENLEIKSPLDGVVLTSKVEDAERLPVQVGEGLFEVAPLRALKVLVRVPADEISHLAAGQDVQLRLDAYPDQKLSGVVEKIRPRSEIHDSENVFVAEVLLENIDQRIRP
ncbi:MAG: HlyD family efflux transporter periplasmic adaptor subunit, partial [Planctomycetota bacterium]|nr:HlyD family efflux transporter periplasmic adaptor subunit [Planctomycetota bacterium]